MKLLPFWERVKYLIKTHKTTQDEIAGLIGIPLGTLRNWMYNNRLPDVETGCDLAVVLGVTVDYLVYGKNRKVIKERMSRLLERKTAASRINKLAKDILKQSGTI